MSKKEATSIDRRDFFRKVGLGAGAAAVGVAASTAEAATPEKGPAKGVGYRETEHIKTYYELARF
jgi:hypothetical protein